ncbi:transcriptional-regulating factor 1-like [Betta splendens]|uniref:Transcriptional-regulating factor 1-like n=1 Tax=Betta splendens TaxID=158456 RepID=A0A6P7LVA3_BETSP|nr:transcriptional-regulating factor 1-like [Betta splendens]XP_028998731.1 transcriptional-regulating factor 1-like [Betta splendens]XP_028998733.1 transcriptional-regulating factor 1-like [Betta splendens]XP_055362847.1 transcriptional-regulating factor 1-like [Betta splendens]XP_055362848.1 transcriptional-regulating factor 1-like [Betta splendens]
MDERSFPNLHSHRHHPSYHLGVQSPEAGYLSSQSALDSLEPYANRGEESAPSFPTSNTSSGGRKGSSAGERGFLSTTGSSVGEEAGLGGHLDGPGRLSSHYGDPWYGVSKKEDVWEDGESCGSSADDFNGNTSNLFYSVNCGGEEGRSKLRANYTSNTYAQVNCEVKSEPLYSEEANAGHFTKQCGSYNRSAGSFSDSSVDYCRTDLKGADFLGREEDYGSSCGSGEEQLPSADAEGPWLPSPLVQSGEERWRGAAGCPPQRIYPQKLDSFSEAFLSQRKRRFPFIPGGDGAGQMWDFGVGRGDNPGLPKSRHSCAFDSDAYLPPSSSPSPGHPSLPSFPSPSASSHLISSVLSPPPTPLPPPSHSPSKMDSPGAFGGTGHSVPQGGDPLGTLQFFTSRLPSLPSVHNAGMIWKIPMLSHCYPQTSDDLGSGDGNLRPSHGGDFENIPAPHEGLKSPDLPPLPSSAHRPSLHAARALCPSNAALLHLSSRSSQLPVQRYEEAEKTTPYLAMKAKNGPTDQNQPQQQELISPQKKQPPAFTGTPFPSVLRSGRGQARAHFTPPPLLNPCRRGTGLYSSVSSLHLREEVPACGQGDKEVLPRANVGPEFQAELPSCPVNAKKSGLRTADDESPREQLLWKPKDRLDESSSLQDQVEKLLSVCSSSCLPGGGSNTELALHRLHYCQGNILATLESLLFSQPSPAGDYHYSGSDVWTDAEKNAFSAALGAYGKDFALIQKMVRTKSTRQCVEFYYLSKKILDKQKKLEEQEIRDLELEQQKSALPSCQPMERPQEAVPVPPLASFFPCKLCGKMFYKIKSRNAHMKIHRQPQEDWTDRQLQHQLLTQRLALSHSTSLIPTSNLLSSQPAALTFDPSGLPGALSNKTNAETDLNSVANSNVADPSPAVTYSSMASSDSHETIHIGAGDSNQREPTIVLPFPQSWGSFGHIPDPAAFYCSADGKEHVEAGAAGRKEPPHWP